MEDNIYFIDDSHIFSFRVAGYITCKDKVLLDKGASRDFYSLVGGRVQFGESAEEAIVREIKEELGLDIVNFQLMHIGESIFEWRNRRAQELDFVFKIELDEKYLNRFSGFHVLDQAEESVWVDKKEIEKLDCRPNYIYHLPALDDGTLSRSVQKDDEVKIYRQGEKL